MAGSGDIRAGRAFVELTTKDAQLKKGLDAARKRLDDFGNGVRNVGLALAGIGAAVLTPLLASAKLFSDTGDALAKMAARTGFAVESLSGLSFAASQSGSSMEELENGIRKMQSSIVEAAQGLQTQQRALAALGLSAQELMKLSPEEQFAAIADGISAMEDPTLRSAIAVDILGRAGTKLLPLMKDGAAGLERMKREAAEFGLVVSSESAAKAEKFNDAIDLMFRVVKMASFEIGASLAPILTDLAIKVARTVAAVNDWIRNNSELIVTVAKIAAGVLLAGGVLIGLGIAIKIAAVATGLLGTLLTAVLIPLKLATALFVGLWAVITSPSTLAIAAILGVVAAIVYFTGTASKAVEFVKSAFDGMRADVTTAMGAIGNALASGDIALAAKVLWLTLRLEWAKGIGFLQETWAGLVGNLLTAWAELKFGLAGFMLQAWGEIQRIGIDAVMGLLAGWTEFTAKFKSLWTSSQTWVEKGFLKLMNAAGQLTDQELADAMKMADANRDAALAGIEQERSGKQATLSTVQSLAQEEADKKQKGVMDQLAQDKANELAGIAADTETGVQAAADALAQTRTEWQAAIDAANQLEPPKPQEAFKAGEFVLPDFDAVTKKIEKARGTFNAAAVLSLQSGNDDAAKATARNTARTNSLLERIDRSLDESLPVFT